MLNFLHEFWGFELRPSCHFSNPEKLIFLKFLKLHLFNSVWVEVSARSSTDVELRGQLAGVSLSFHCVV